MAPLVPNDDMKLIELKLIGTHRELFVIREQRINIKVNTKDYTIVFIPIYFSSTKKFFVDHVQHLSVLLLGSSSVFKKISASAQRGIILRTHW